MDVRKLRLITIAGPIAYVLGVEVLSIFVLLPLAGSNAVVRLLIIFGLLVLAVVPFSFWVFAVIERQQLRLTESAEMLDSVQDHAIFMLDVSGRIVTWSSGAERIKGYRAGEVVGQSVSIFYLPEDVDQGIPQKQLQVTAAEGRHEYEGWRIRKDGSRFWANVVSTAVCDDRGALLGFTHVARDMTERREAEHRIHGLNEELKLRVRELAVANEEIERRARQLDAANHAITSISRALDLSHVLQNIVDEARNLLHSRYAALGVVNQEGRIVQFITSGITPEQREAIGLLPRGQGLLGTLIKEAKPLRVRTISEDPRSSGFPPNHPMMQNFLGVPILFNGKPIGDLYLTDKLGAIEFSQEDEDLLMLLANHAAVAIENARLYEEVRAARDRLQLWNQELEARIAARTAEIERHSKDLTTRVLQAQEEERKRIARELHDDTAQSLSTILINLDLLEPAIPVGQPLLQAGFERVRTLVKRTLDETRALSHYLRPTILDDFGLTAALLWFSDEYTHTYGVPVEVNVEEMPVERLNPDVELALFRIAQEALTNTGKYADAKRAHVSVSFPDGMAKMEIADDGKGFDPGSVQGPTGHGGLGLYGMQERTDLLHGTLHVESAPGTGTRVAVLVPLAGETGECDTLLRERGENHAHGYHRSAGR